MQDLVVWSLDQQRYALPFSVVERVVRVVAFTPLPDAPAIVCGMINLQGRLLAVIDMRARFGLPLRPLQLSDQLLIARMRKRDVALLVDGVQGLFRRTAEAPIPTDTVLPDGGSITGIAKFPDGMILIHDLDRCLSLEEEHALAHALSEATS